MRDLHLYVTPRVGVWIETFLYNCRYLAGSVTPRVGVWIETLDGSNGEVFVRVTPRVGVWIETPMQSFAPLPNGCHSPRGSVD